MWRSIIIILFLCGAVVWVLTGGENVPQRSGTLTINPAPDFPKESQADLGRSVAKILPHCPGLAQLGGELLFTGLKTEGEQIRISFTVPAGAKVPQNWGSNTGPCDYIIQGDELLMRGPLCQALCLGKLAEPSAEMVRVNLNPAPTVGKQ